jgi:Cu(I)/Ag(I) efflux system membrane protein CusA/SilA
VERIRPMSMAGLANIFGLIPVMWATGTGADVMKRLAAPMVGGVCSAMLLTLFVIPAVYVLWRWWKERSENQIGVPVRTQLQDEDR